MNRLPARRHSAGGANLEQRHPLPFFRYLAHRRSITKDNFFLGPEIGRGGFGYVRRAKHNGKDVVAKFLHVASGEAELSEATKEGLKTEAALLAEKRHKNIVSFLGYSNSHACILTDYCANRSLHDVLRDKTKRHVVEDYGNRLRWLQDIADAMMWLHHQEPYVIHRDLKPSNIFLDELWVAKVGDFGLARIVDVFDNFITVGQRYNKAYLMLLYQPPEVIAANLSDNQRSAYSRKSDVYSYGLLIQELLTLKNAYGIEEEELADANTIWGTVYAVMDGRLRPEVPEDRSTLPGRFEPCLEPLIELMHDCCQGDPKDRPDFIEIYRRIKKIREDYGQTTPPSCTAVKAVAWIVGIVLVLLIAVSSLLYLIPDVATSKGRFSPVQAMGCTGFMILLLFIAMGCCYQFKKSLNQRCAARGATQRDVISRSELEMVRRMEKRAEEIIAKKPRQISPFALVAACRGASVVSSFDLHKLSYSVPRNATQICNAFLRELPEDADCLYIQDVRRFCHEHRDAPDITQDDWHSLIASCLNSEAVRETKTWTDYETACRIPSETRIDILPTIPSDPFRPGPSTPVAISRTAESRDDGVHCSSGRDFKDSIFGTRALEPESGEGFSDCLSQSISTNSASRPRPPVDVWHFTP